MGVMKEKPTTIYGLKFECTSSACPEQYNIYKDGEPVAYFRFRYGSIEVHPQIEIFDPFSLEKTGHTIDFERTIYEKNFNNFDGEFNSEKQRQEYLMKVAREINEFIATGKTKSERTKKTRAKKNQLQMTADQAKILFDMIMNFDEDENEHVAVERKIPKARRLGKKEEQQWKPLKYNPPKIKTCELIEKPKGE